MTTRPGLKAKTIAFIFAVFGSVALSWPLLEIPVGPCEAQQLSLSIELLTRCALQPLLWILAVWLILLGALIALSQRGRDSHGRRRREPPGE